MWVRDTVISPITKEDLLEKWEITPKSMIYGDEKHVLKAIVLNSAKVTI